MTREEKRATRSDNIPKLFYWIRKVKINDGGGVNWENFLTILKIGFAATKNLPNQFSFSNNE